jgi:hypothetical protein
MSTPGKEQVRRLSITISSATGTGNLTPEWTLTRWIRVIPVAETDSYDVTLKDGESHIIMKRTGQVGTLSENLVFSLGIVKSILIENASQDGTYVFKADLH